MGRAASIQVVEKDGSKVTVKSKPLPDLLTHYLMRKAPGAETALKQRLDFQLAAYRR